MRVEQGLLVVGAATRPTEVHGAGGAVEVGLHPAPRAELTHVALLGGALEGGARHRCRRPVVSPGGGGQAVPVTRLATDRTGDVCRRVGGEQAAVVKETHLTEDVRAGEEFGLAVGLETDEAGGRCEVPRR